MSQPFTPEIMGEYIREELRELEKRPGDPRTMQELRESFAHYGRAYKPWKHGRRDWVNVP